jgi:hypothetical protein
MDHVYMEEKLYPRALPEEVKRAYTEERMHMINVVGWWHPGQTLALTS